MTMQTSGSFDLCVCGPGLLLLSPWIIFLVGSILLSLGPSGQLDSFCSPLFAVDWLVNCIFSAFQSLLQKLHLLI